MKIVKVLIIVIAILFFLLFFLLSLCKASSNDIFWFILAGDSHIGSGEDASDNLYWLVNDCYKEINPKFIVNAGDLTDQHPIAQSLGGEQDIEEWEDYSQILYDSNMDLVIDDAPVYIDIPGNHDIYHENAPLTNYQNYSIQKITIDANQRIWYYDDYYFLGINTTHTGMTIPMEDGANGCP